MLPSAPRLSSPTSSSASASPSPSVPLPLPLLLAATTRLLHVYRVTNPSFCPPPALPRRCLTRPSLPLYNDSLDNRHHDLILHVGDILSDTRANSYTVLDLLGTGTFGQVAKCIHLPSSKIVAVKIIKNQPAYFNQAWVEINILHILHRTNSSRHTTHIVNLYSHFIFRAHLCLVFEKLSINLYQLLKQNNHKGLALHILRTFLIQILHALTLLVNSDVIHCDLKPENILLQQIDSTNFKLIDFGSACQLQHPVYSYVQSRYYRSPEILLGSHHYDSNIDMWSLGCVTAELFLGIPVFPGQNELNMIHRIIDMLGDIPDRFLRRCRNTHKFFNYSPPSECTSDVKLYRVKTVAEYDAENNTTLPKSKRFFKKTKLRDIIMTYPMPANASHSDEYAMRESLIDLLNGMLKFDPHDRWAPTDAIAHPFIRGLPLLHGQPWIPPRLRIMRCHPAVAIPISHRDRNSDFHHSITSPVDSVYSASAPNFNGMGQLAMNLTWGTGAGGQPPTRRPIHAHYYTNNNPPGYSPTSYADFELPNEPSGFASASCLSDSTFSMFDNNNNNNISNNPTMPLYMSSRPSYPTYPIYPTYPSSSSSSARRVHQQQPIMAPGSYSGPSHAPYMHAPLSPASEHLHRTPPSNNGNGHSPNASLVPSTATTPPMSYNTLPASASSLRQQQLPLQRTFSRESMTNSLRLSASGDSLGYGVSPSIGDMADDQMFPFSCDEDTMSSSHTNQGNAACGSTASTNSASQLSPLMTQSIAMGINSTGASASLPPPGPRLLGPQLRQTGSGTYGGNPPSQFVFSYTGQHQSRPYNPDVSELQQRMADLGVNPASSNGGRASMQGERTEPLVNSDLFDASDSRRVFQSDADSIDEDYRKQSSHSHRPDSD